MPQSRADAYLQLRNKNPKRKVAAKLREDRVMATAPNDCWAMDFMVDQLFDGRKLRVLTIVDIYTKLCPAIGVAHAYKGHDVAGTLEAAAREHGRPKRIRVDNGPEFVSRDLDLWAWQHGVVHRLWSERPARSDLSRIATGFSPLVALSIAEPICFSFQKGVQRLLNRAPNHPAQVPLDPLVVDRDDIRQRKRPMAASFLSSG